MRASPQDTYSVLGMWRIFFSPIRLTRTRKFNYKNNERNIWQKVWENYLSNDLIFDSISRTKGSIQWCLMITVLLKLKWNSSHSENFEMLSQVLINESHTCESRLLRLSVKQQWGLEILLNTRNIEIDVKTGRHILLAWFLQIFEMQHSTKLSKNIWQEGWYEIFCSTWC